MFADAAGETGLKKINKDRRRMWRMTARTPWKSAGVAHGAQLAWPVLDRRHRSPDVAELDRSPQPPFESPLACVRAVAGVLGIEIGFCEDGSC